jgi:hypothetical protein
MKEACQEKEEEITLKEKLIKLNQKLQATHSESKSKDTLSYYSKSSMQTTTRKGLSHYVNVLMAND